MAATDWDDEEFYMAEALANQAAIDAENAAWALADKTADAEI